MIRNTEARIVRLETALVELANGVDWSPQRGSAGREALRELCAEFDTAKAAEAREQRKAALETELAALGGSV